NAAHRAGAEVIPIGVAYDHADAYFFKEPFINHMKRIASRRRLTVAVEIGGPLEPAAEPTIELKDYAQARVAQLSEQAKLRLAAHSEIRGATSAASATPTPLSPVL